MTCMYSVRYSLLPLRRMALENKSFDSQGYYSCMTLANLIIITKTAFSHQWNEEFGQWFQIFLSQEPVKGRLMSSLSPFKSTDFPSTPFSFLLAIYLLSKQVWNFADCIPVVFTCPFVPVLPGKRWLDLGLIKFRFNFLARIF